MAACARGSRSFAAGDRARLAAIVADRNRRQKHVERARIVLLSADGVGGPGRLMPHAEVTYRRFWLSTAPHRPAAIGAAGVDGWAPGDPCPN
jgi:hypothetical protein